MHPLLPATLSLLFMAPGRGLAEDPLDRARDLFKKLTERAVHEATAICLAEESPDAARLLLEVLDRDQSPRGALAPAHFRDIVWGGLEKLSDPYARAVVAHELKTNKDDPFMRQWCAQLIGLWGQTDLADPVRRALRDRDDGVRSAAARALGRLRYEPAAKSIAKLRTHKNIYLRANAIEALVRIDADLYREEFEKGLADKDGGVRCALLGAVLEIYPDRAEALSLSALRDPDWRPRIQAVQNLSAIKTKTAVDGLVRAVEDGRPVVGNEAIDGLQTLTGMKYSRPDQWKSWWRDNRGTFAFPENPGEGGGHDQGRTETYHGLPIVSDHVAFLIDISARMGGTLKSKDMEKSRAAYEELASVLAQLEGRLVFNVFTFNEEVEAYGKRPAKLSMRTRKAALSFLADAPTRGQKDIWQVLETVILDPELDTAYLLSSGEPDVGLYVHWNRVTDHLADLNRFHKVVIHSVAYSDNKWYRDQLERISQATGGQFRYFE